MPEKKEGFKKQAKGVPLFEQGDIDLLDPPQGLMEVRKKPVVVHAMLMNEPFVCRTLEGDMQGKPGDYLMVGVAGEVYPCKPEIFEQTYVVQSMSAPYAEGGEDQDGA